MPVLVLTISTDKSFTLILVICEIYLSVLWERNPENNKKDDHNEISTNMYHFRHNI
jgi:hypothetical protein